MRATKQRKLPNNLNKFKFKNGHSDEKPVYSRNFEHSHPHTRKNWLNNYK